MYKKLHGGAEYVLRFEDEDQVAPFCRAVRAPCLHAIVDGRTYYEILQMLSPGSAV